MKEQFIKFLKENDVYEEFVQRYNNCPLHSMTLNEFLTTHKPSKWIKRAFLWGGILWVRLNAKWIEYLKQNK